MKGKASVLIVFYICMIEYIVPTMNDEAAHLIRLDTINYK